MTQDISLRVALDRAAYALFQLKRFADMPKAAVEFCREAHLEACEVLDKDFRSAPHGSTGVCPAVRAGGRLRALWKRRRGSHGTGSDPPPLRTHEAHGEPTWRALL